MKRFFFVLACIVGTALGASGEPWKLDNRAIVPGNFWTITSPDGKWKLLCAPRNDEIELDSAGTADLAIVNDYYYREAYDYDLRHAVESADKYPTADEGCVLRGSGVLTLPVSAVDGAGRVYSVDVGDWSLEGWSAPVRAMTKCVVPADFTNEIGEGTSITAPFEVEAGNPKYYSADGVLYLREAYREDGGEGDVLLQFPSGRTGTFTIPDGVTKVRTGAFEYSQLTELVIGSDLEEFESDHEVRSAFKKITVRNNPRFKFLNGFLIRVSEDEMEQSIVLTLHGLMTGTVRVPSCVTRIESCAMSYLKNLDGVVFSSCWLSLDGWAFDECENVKVLDFRGVGELTVKDGGFDNIRESDTAMVLRLPAATCFEESEWYGIVMPQFGDGVQNVYWPTDYSWEDLGCPWFVSESPVTLHILKTSGNWDRFTSDQVRVVKDIVTVDADFGPFVPGVEVSETLVDLIGYAAKGLPTGLKFDTATGLISGVPTTPSAAGAVVTFTKTGEDPVEVALVVGPYPQLAIETIGEGSGTAKGAGGYAAYKKISLSATADKNSVFAGWYYDVDGYSVWEDADWRSPKISYEMPPEDETLYAKFVPIADDVAALEIYGAADEYATMQTIDDIYVDDEGCASLPTVKVTGLPSGLKFTAKDILSRDSTADEPIFEHWANTIYGTPTKSGIYSVTVSVTTAGKQTAAETNTVVVINREAGERILNVISCGEGKATGAGVYMSGKTVALKATANKTSVFAGWYADEACEMPVESGVDCRMPSLSYVTSKEDETLYAKFVSASDDTDIWLAADDGTGAQDVSTNAAETVFYTSGAMDLVLAAESWSLPKIAVSGLPAGLKFTANPVYKKGSKTEVEYEANTIYGTATKPGTYVVTAKLTNATVKKAVERRFTIVIDNLTGANGLLRDALNNARGDGYVVPAGVMEFDLPRIRPNNGVVAKVAGLPAGLKYDAASGEIVGIATKAGTFTVSVTIGKAVSTFTIQVDPLPEWVVGSFETVIVKRDEFKERDAVTVSPKGDIAIKFCCIYDENPESGTDRTALRRVDRDGVYHFERLDVGGDDLESWNDTYAWTITPREIDGVVFGVIEGVSDCRGVDNGYEWDELNQIFGAQNVWTRAAGSRLAPNIVKGSEFDLDMSTWRAHGYQEEPWDAGEYLTGCELRVKYNRNGVMLLAFFDRGATTASATASTVLAPYELSEDGRTLKALVSTVIAPRGKPPIGLALYFDIDISGGVVYGTDFRLTDYYMCLNHGD